MTETELLDMLKADLEIVNSLQDTYLTQLISAAQSAIAEEGIEIFDPPSSVADGHLVEMYAAYLYRKRKTDNPSMPRMLRHALNNRKFHQTMEAGDSDAL